MAIMSLSTQPYKGARDFYPEDKRIQNYMFDIMRRTARQFGYEEYDAPILEPTDLYLQKGNQEIIAEQTYTFTDRGDRSITIRTEMTPSVSRMVAGKRQELAYPVRWFSIPNLWRYERPQRGRLREFWQLNVDVFGVDGIEADFEIIQVADAILKNFGARSDMYTIKLNSRKLVNVIMQDYLELSEVQAGTMIQLIDRMNKLDRMQFVAQAESIFSPSQRDSGALNKLVDLLAVKRVSQLPEELKASQSVMDITKLITMLENAGVSNAVFDISLMRGFDYYTDIVFEVFDTHPDNNRAMFGGGRYDGLVALFGVEPVPTVGFGMGDVTLQNFIETHGLMPVLQTETDAYVILIGDVFEQAQRTLLKLRQMGLNLAVDPSNRKIDKQIKTASKKGITYILFIGETELATDQIKIKNLETGAEEQHSPERIVSIVRRGKTRVLEEE